MIVNEKWLKRQLCIRGKRNACRDCFCDNKSQLSP